MNFIFSDESDDELSRKRNNKDQYINMMKIPYKSNIFNHIEYLLKRLKVRVIPDLVKEMSLVIKRGRGKIDKLENPGVEMRKLSICIRR